MQVSTNADHFTALIEFSSDPSERPALLEQLDTLAGLFPAQPGFVSQHFLSSADGARVLCYVQWKDEASHLACLGSDQVAADSAPLMALVEAGRVQMHVDGYEVVHTSEAS